MPLDPPPSYPKNRIFQQVKTMKDVTYAGTPETPLMLDFALKSPESALQVVGVFPDGTLTSADPQVASRIQGLLKQLRLKEGEKMHLEGVSFQEAILAVGVGLPLTPKGWQEMGARLMRAIPAEKIGALRIESLSEEEVLAVAYGCQLGSWRLTRYHTAARPLSPRCAAVVLVTPHGEGDTLRTRRKADHHLIDSLHWARDLANRPGNDITPRRFMEYVREFEALGVEVRVLDQAALKAQGFGALLGVAQGSVHEPYLVTASWKGVEEGPITALVGKGVTFDTGGISLKPSNNMGEMKLDKTGAVVVAACVRALALQKAPVKVVAVLALVENMPSGSAQRPGDIVTSSSGQTIEVLDTDAEGRLILADALTYAQEQFSPSVMVDVATLTGAVRAALGPVYAGLCTNHGDLAQQLMTSGEQTGEVLWRLPLHKDYDKALDSDVADMKNITASGYGAGSSTAAQFLARFVKKDQAWAHLDIAGVDMAGKETPLCPRGGSAFGIQLLVHWILNQRS